MSRTKKSRKPGGAPTAKPKLSKQELEKVEKRIRKKTGKVAGNRQKEAKSQLADDNKVVNKDPRLGSKKAIVLGKVTTKAEKSAQAKTTSAKVAAIANVRFVDNSDTELSLKQTLTVAQQLEAIEEDEMLQSILAKQEANTDLTEQDVNYYNDMMDRHQALSAELGLDEDDEFSESDAVSDSEDDLWDKLDRTDFSDFDNKE